MPDETPPSPDEAACNREFDLYEGYRKEVLPVEREAEKSFDTFLGTISVAAIGSTFTLLNDVSKGAGKGWIIASWVFFALCLLISLGDRLATYYVNKRGREIYDRHFADWKPGAFTAATQEALRHPVNTVLEYSKYVATAFFGVGLLLLLIGIASSWAGPIPPEAPQPPITVNVYSVPSTQQVKP